MGKLLGLGQVAVDEQCVGREPSQNRTLEPRIGVRGACQEPVELATTPVLSLACGPAPESLAAMRRASSASSGTGESSAHEMAARVSSVSNTLRRKAAPTPTPVRAAACICAARSA